MKNTLFLSILFSVFLCKNLYGQTDSLVNFSAQELKDKSRNFRYSDLDLAKVYAQELLDRGLKKSDLEDISDGYHQLGMVNQIKGNYTTSIEQFNIGINWAQKLKDSLRLIELYWVRGNSYLYSNDQKKALSNYTKAQYISKKQHNLRYEIISWVNIASVKKEIGQLHEALEIERKNLKLSQNIQFKKKTTPVDLIMNLGETFLKLNENDSAIFYSKKGLAKSLEIDDIDGTSYFYVNLGLAYANKKEYKNALGYFEKAEKVIITFNNEKRLIQVHYHLANSNYQLKAYNTSIAYLGKAERLIEKNQYQNTPDALKVYDLYAKVHELLGDIDLSNQYYKKYVATDNLLDKNTLEVIQDVHKSDLKNKNSEIASIAQKRKQQQNQLNTIIIISLSILIIIGIFLFRSIKKSRKNKYLFNDLLKKIEKKKAISPNQTISITDKKTLAVLTKLKEYEEKAFYLHPDFSLINLAKKVKTNPTYLSKIINEHKKMKFQAYTNDLRINYAIHRLKEDKKFRSYAVQHIAKEIGYKSPYSFSRHFKKQTGIHPSVFISKINTKESSR